MCGIVGYVGPRQATPILMDGLKRMEYRGYDSAGIAVLDGHKLTVRRAAGKLSELAREIADDAPTGTLGIGHTRWATHGHRPRKMLILMSISRVGSRSSTTASSKMRPTCAPP